MQEATQVHQNSRCLKKGRDFYEVLLGVITESRLLNFH